VRPTEGRVVVPWAHSHSLVGETVSFRDLKDLPEAAGEDREFFQKAGVKSLISLPLTVEGRVIGVLVLASHRAHTNWPEETIRRLKLIADVFAGMAERKRAKAEMEEQLRFNGLVAELSVRFIDLPAAQVEGAIEEAQRAFCETFGLDRSALYEHFEKD